MKYEKPEIKVLYIEIDDVVCASDNDIDFETPQEPW